MFPPALSTSFLVSMDFSSRPAPPVPRVGPGVYLLTSAAAMYNHTGTSAETRGSNSTSNYATASWRPCARSHAPAIQLLSWLSPAHSAVQMFERPRQRRNVAYVHPATRRRSAVYTADTWALRVAATVTRSLTPQALGVTRPSRARTLPSEVPSSYSASSTARHWRTLAAGALIEHLSRRGALGNALMGLWIVVLLGLLMVCAERFFCPALEVISDALSLPPNVAGATLLSFGNGAPDVFTQLAAMSSVRGPSGHALSPHGPPRACSQCELLRSPVARGERPRARRVALQSTSRTARLVRRSVLCLLLQSGAARSATSSQHTPRIPEPAVQLMITGCCSS